MTCHIKTILDFAESHYERAICLQALPGGCLLPPFLDSLLLYSTVISKQCFPNLPFIHKPYNILAVGNLMTVLLVDLSKKSMHSIRPWETCSGKQRNFNFLLVSLLQRTQWLIWLFIEVSWFIWAIGGRRNVLLSPMNYLLFYHCWVKSALIWYIKKLPYKSPKGKHHDTALNNNSLEEKISKCWDWLHHRIYFMASSKYTELLPLCRVSSPSTTKMWAGKCQCRGQPECRAHTYLCYLPTAQAWQELSHQKLSTHICTLSELPPQEWVLSHQSQDRGLLTSRPLKEGGKSPGAPSSPWERSGYVLRLRHNVVSLDGDGYLPYCAK